MQTLHPKCAKCNCAQLATQTFNNIADLPEEEWHWYCLAMMDGECLEGEPMNEGGKQ